MPLFLLSTHKHYIHIRLFNKQLNCYFPWKPYTLAGFEPGSCCSWGGYDVHCATPPSRQGSTFFYLMRRQGDQMVLRKNGPKLNPINTLKKLTQNFFCGKLWSLNVGQSCTYFSCNQRKFAQSGCHPVYRPSLCIEPMRHFPRLDQCSYVHSTYVMPFRQCVLNIET
jgi:hypothetical protein